MAGTVANYFTRAQASRISGVPERRLARWERMGLVRPPLPGFFDFRNLVELRALELLFTEHHIPIHGRRGLRAASKYLHEEHDRPWAELRLFVAGHEVFFKDAGDIVSATGRGQLVAKPSAIDLRPLERAARAEAQRLSRRSAADVGEIAQTRGVHGNAPCVKGTRIPTALVWRLTRQGVRRLDLLRSYPSLKSADVSAALAFERKRRQGRRAA